ncbi:TraR/DksA family transcriptional regulator [Ruania halotolerans]|uniref:TraR/DksA family transcriptional regulator n=1 Tax=Ruania halotolerans TaxID=2897773 RepID=UPI001E50C927|nr:TraR/DksA C4-type zinc finger protein [Ruania halotolerans]UFU06544.1 TraR/DksA C4-type zinc finger protein [Ruania halotolerans]
MKRVDPPTNGQLAELRRMLTAERERTSDRIAALTQNVTSIVEGAQLTVTDDEHDPEGATIAFERSQAGALLAAANTHLVDVDAALAKFASGTYGRCELCGEPIVAERLLARPASRTCITCAAQTRR